MEIRVEGHMQGGVLVAGEIELADGGIAIAARVIGVDFSDAKNGTVTLDLGHGQNLSVRTGNATQFADDSMAGAQASFDLDELIAGTDFVQVRAYRNDRAQLVATRIEREAAGQETLLEAPVEGFVSNASVRLLGITWTVGAGTLYGLNGLAGDATRFFAALHSGDIVEVRDIEPDGTADALRLEVITTGPAPGPHPNPVPDTGLAGIDISFKLDPRLTQSLYMGDRWVSPPTYTRLQEPGKPLTVDARVSGIDTSGRPVAISAAWIPSDPGLVSVSPDQGDQVLITILNAGQSTLKVTAQGISRELRISATVYVENVLKVDISQ